jgi:hypothetical protein
MCCDTAPCRLVTDGEPWAAGRTTVAMLLLLYKLARVLLNCHRHGGGTDHPVLTPYNSITYSMHPPQQNSIGARHWQSVMHHAAVVVMMPPGNRWAEFPAS